MGLLNHQVSEEDSGSQLVLTNLSISITDLRIKKADGGWHFTPLQKNAILSFSVPVFFVSHTQNTNSWDRRKKRQGHVTIATKENIAPRKNGFIQLPVCFGKARSFSIETDLKRGGKRWVFVRCFPTENRIFPSPSLLTK